MRILYYKMIDTLKQHSITQMAIEKINILIEQTKTGYSAYAEDLPVCSTGKDLTALKKGILEALNLYFEDKQKMISENNLAIH